jgi:hypothetical protein
MTGYYILKEEMWLRSLRAWGHGGMGAGGRNGEAGGEICRIYVIRFFENLFHYEKADHL